MPGDEPWKPYPEHGGLFLEPTMMGTQLKDGGGVKSRALVFLSSLLGKVQQWRAEGVFMGGKG